MRKYSYILLLLTITLIPISIGQTINIENLKIVPSENGYLVSGTVVAKDLNPDGQVVEDDYVEIRAEIRKGVNSTYPVLYDTRGYYPPDGKSMYIKNEKYIDYDDAVGRNITSITISAMHLRDYPVWSAYGGIGKWRENAPSSVKMNFNGTIPKEYEGKEVRIHAMLSHTWGGPNAYWPATTYHHWVKTIILPPLDSNSVDVSHSANDNMGSNDNSNNNNNNNANDADNANNNDNTNKKSIIDEKFRKLLEILRKAGHSKSKESIGNPKFKNPQTNDINVGGNKLDKTSKERMDNTQQKLEEIGATSQDIEVVEVKTPYGKDVKITQSDGKIVVKKDENSAQYFKFKYYVNKYLLDNFADTALGAIPIIGLYKDYVKSDKDSNIFSDNELTKKTAMDLHVDEKTANFYNTMSGIEDREKKLSPLKNSIPTPAITKPFDFITNMMGVGIKKCVANDYRWEYNHVREYALIHFKSGEKYRDIIRNTISDYETWGMYEDPKSQTLNAQSKGDYKDYRARIRLYLMQMYENGELRRDNNE